LSELHGVIFSVLSSFYQKTQMKKTIAGLFFFLANLAVLGVYANDALTLVSGHVIKEKAQAVTLYQVIEGKKVEYATTKLDAHNDFGFALLSVKEGFYYLADQNKKDFTRIYLKAGEKLELRLNEDGYEVIKGSKENLVLHDWFTRSYVITNPSFNWLKDTSTYTTYFPKLEAFVPQVPAYKASIKTPNRHFNDLMKMAVDMDVEHAAMYFLLTPNTIHPKKEQYPSYYRQIIQPQKYKSASLLELGEGVELLARYATFNSLYNRESLDQKPVNLLQYNADLFGNDTLKGAFIASALRFRTYEDLQKNIEPVKQYLISDSMQAAYFRALKSLADFKKGSPSYNFSYEDVTGKKVSMNDLKGKVVLVDVWATWCGPCRAEIPHLKKLEEELKDKNIEFVSISVDEEKDRSKWKNMIEKEQLGGTQLFASGWSEIAKYYNITGIPRFMVFDQQGKIVSVNSPRPSQPELKQLLETTLEEK
jgi:thiol-disulfide isomerase/thioredoxin